MIGPIIGILVLGAGIYYHFSKNSEFAAGALEHVKSGSEKKYLTSAEHPDAVFQYIKSEEFTSIRIRTAGVTIRPMILRE
mgnify:CR=1 FL=1